MSDSALLEVVFNRVASDKDLAANVGEVILAAMDGDIEATLDGKAAPPTPPAATVVPPPSHMYIKSILAGGFRGIGAPCMLEVAPGPGLTLVIGRNGSGKSSFAEALELLVTGDNRRWSERPAGWREGWRNLHYQAARISAEFLEDGSAKPLKLERSWKDDAELDATEALYARGDAALAPAKGLDWKDAVTNFRPFLSYNELGTLMDDGPSKLHDALAMVLGVEPMLAAADRVVAVRKKKEAAKDDAKAALAVLNQLLVDCQDARAAGLKAAVHGKKADLVKATSLAGDADAGEGGAERARLTALVNMRGPTTTEVDAAAAALEAALTAAAVNAGTDAEQAHRIKDVLDAALAAHKHRESDSCPVCSTASVFGDGWRTRAEAEVTALAARAEEAQKVRLLLKGAEDAARRLVQTSFPSLTGDETSLPELKQALASWQQVAQAQLGEWPALLRTRHAALSLAVDMVHLEAGEKLKAMEDVWRPIAAAARTWVALEEQARRNVDAVKDLKAAEDWLKAAAISIRNERFAPIQEQVKNIWNLLRQQSSVELSELAFEGKAKQRKVNLGVTVDGKKGNAIGVMSQGELHSLALSLFLPRATLPASPFGFIVVDDPVQAMDPAKVDGLARVLDSFSGTRQVVVFTHDDRLPEAVRRLGIKATVLEVQRGPSSSVTVRRALVPHQQYILDARALVKTEGLPVKVLNQCLPGLCRNALEAACVEVVRRRRLGAGMPHAKVEELLTTSKRLLSKVALVLADDAEKAGDVTRMVAQKFGGNAAAILKECNKGTHEGLEGLEPDTFINDAEKLVKALAVTP